MDESGKSKSGSTSPPVGPQQEFLRKQVLKYHVLAILWIAPSFGAILILLLGRLQRGGEERELSEVPMEDWISLAVLLVHLLWLWRWRAWRNRQKAAS